MSTSSHSGRAALLALAVVLAFARAGAARAEVSAGGATAPVAGVARDEAQVLRERAQQYWEARVAGSARVLEFYAPPEKGGPRGPGEVSEGGNLRFTAFEIEGVELGGDAATVLVRVEASLPVRRELARTSAERSRLLREVWDRVDGTWYKRPVPRGFGRGYAPDRRKP
jgi:hypothetical protein